MRHSRQDQDEVSRQHSNDVALKAIQKEEETHDIGMIKFLQKLIEGRMTRNLLRMVADVDNELRGR